MSTIEIAVHGLSSGGLGVGVLPDGKVVFLPRTAPGDRVLARITKEKSRWARGEALEWLERGGARAEPECVRYSECDGCSLQHVSYEEQLAWKGRFVGDALRRLGGLSVTDPHVVPSSRELRYRNKVTFTLRRLQGGRVVAGFRALGSQGRVLDIGPECLLPEEPLSLAWKELREGWGAGARFLPPGGELRLTLRGVENGAALLIRGGRGDGDPESLLSNVAGLTSVWREEKDGPTRHLAGDPMLAVPWGDEVLQVTGSGFVQVNREAGEALQAYVLSQAGPVMGKRVVDAYCGVGVMGRALALAQAEVVGIEIEPAGAPEAESGSEGGFTIVVGRVEEELPSLLPADLVILNPPRTGLAENLPSVLAETPPPTVIYVSCDQATLARDLKRMGEVFQIQAVRAFDLFPQTGHVEIVVTLSGSSEQPSQANGQVG